MRFSLRFQKLALLVATAVCLAGAVAVIAWEVRCEERATLTTAKTIGRTNATSTTPDDDSCEPTREDFARLWDRPLRRALYDPPPPKPVVRELPPLRVEVLGTIIEPDNSMAMVRNEQGSVEYKRIGDSVGPTDHPADVVEIGPESIVVERAAERITLGVQNKNRR